MEWNELGPRPPTTTVSTPIGQQTGPSSLSTDTKSDGEGAAAAAGADLRVAEASLPEQSASAVRADQAPSNDAEKENARTTTHQKGKNRARETLGKVRVSEGDCR